MHPLRHGAFPLSAFETAVTDELICVQVLEENVIVSEITFGETGGGAAMVQGSYVGADQSTSLHSPT